MSSPEPRVLMTTDTVGGVWTYAVSLARALCGRDHEVTLVTLGPAPRRDQVEALHNVTGLSLEITDLALEWMDPQGADMARARDRLSRIFDAVMPDIVHLNSFREAAYGFAASKLVVAHSCVGSWWQACRPRKPLDAQWCPYLRNIASGLDAADAWVAPTAAYRRWLEAHYRPRHSGHMIWNGVAAPSGATAKQPFILAAGRFWDEAKNIAAIAAAAPALDWPVRLAGPATGPNGSGCVGVRNLQMLGVLPHQEMMTQMHRASIFVAPAIYEPFGLATLEAALCGCALVLSDIPAFHELWDGAAVFVEPDDVDALAHALKRLCANEAERICLEQAAGARGRRYSLDAMADQYERLYRTLHAEPKNVGRSRTQRTMELGA